MRSAFWDDHERDLRDPEYTREFAAESARVAALDALVNALEEARAAEGLTKADLARATGITGSAIRRLLTAANPNPTLGTVVEVAAALGLKLAVEPMTEEERRTVTEPMLHGVRKARPGAVKNVA
ncbi:helix-turn-helix domain-containing protein [Promicromonospora sp. NPDC057138]|uniref:helix-turn-helix domain-containing protein n=1 Tax=Promicromonospora sp. NPDC057138 TaxID=3346031 RepID=UPI00363B4046